MSHDGPTIAALQLGVIGLFGTLFVIAAAIFVIAVVEMITIGTVSITRAVKSRRKCHYHHRH